MAEVTLTQILDARENRVRIQNEMLKRLGKPVVCYTMNIAGPQKKSPLIERAFKEGLQLLEKAVGKENIINSDIQFANTGCQAIYSVNGDAEKLKRLCVDIEESSLLGRLFDMDVLAADGKKLERKKERSCIVCGAQGRGCAAGRLHSVDELQSVTSEIITKHFAEKDFERISDLAVESLIDEVYTTPKPGLVDCRNSGSHSDMDITTFIKSANILKPYFKSCIRIGFDTKKDTPEQMFHLLKKQGLKAEEDMYSATNGANTHKGVIYSMGILCAAYGRLWEAEDAKISIENLVAECADISKEAVKTDFEKAAGITAGERLYIEKGVKGIRGEVASGFVSVTKTSLPVYRKALESGLNQNDAGVVSILHLIKNVKDTNLFKRGGDEGVAFAVSSVSRLLKKSPYPEKRQIEKLDDKFIKRNLSPGGCADLLAITYFLHKLSL